MYSKFIAYLKEDKVSVLSSMTLFLGASKEDAARGIRHLSDFRHGDLALYVECTDDEFIAAGDYDWKKEEVISWGTILDLKLSPKEEYLTSIENLLRQEAIQIKAAAKEYGY